MQLPLFRLLMAITSVSGLVALSGCGSDGPDTPNEGCLTNDDCTGPLICSEDKLCVPPATNGGDEAVCGDGVIDEDEVCDDGELNGTPLNCSDTCDGTTEAVCGNDVIEEGETCDDGELNGTPLNCSDTCDGTTEAVCGNDVIEEDEVCDDGELNGEPEQCNSFCTGIEDCGNGVIDDDELCDDGFENGKPNKCNTTCSGTTIPVCGNNVVEAGEECDTAGESITCNADCTRPSLFRIQTAAIIEPGIYYNVPLRSCRNILNVGVSTLLPGGVNGLIRSELEAVAAEPNQHLYALSLALLARPLTQLAGVTFDVDYVLPTCDTALGTCTHNPNEPTVMSQATNGAAGEACLPATDRPGRRADAYPGLNNPVGSCFTSVPTELSMTIGGIAFTLTDAKFVGRYVTDPNSGEVTGINQGVLMGFLPRALAEQIPVNSFPLGSKPKLSTFLGGAGVCVANNNTEDIDIHEGESGWWFYMNYTAARVENWTE